MHKLDSHHFMLAYLCAHRPQSRTAIRHSFCSTLFDSLMDSQIEFGNICEIIISGSGDGKLDTHSMREFNETENQRFLIHILPKNIFETTEHKNEEGSI